MSVDHPAKPSLLDPGDQERFFGEHSILSMANDALFMVELTMTFPKPLPSLSYVTSRLSYLCETGDLIWLPRETFERWNSKHAGKVAGSQDGNYLRVPLKGTLFLAHRLVWLLAHGKEPPPIIDHVNGNGLDNRIENLREASRRENAWNSRAPTNNSSGSKGVSFHKRSKTWDAHIYVTEVDGGRSLRHLGSFHSREEAAQAYSNAAAVIQGEYQHETSRLEGVAQPRRIERELGVSRVRGVTKKGSRWVARIVVNGERLWLGTFDCIDDAERMILKMSAE